MNGNDHLSLKNGLLKGKKARCYHSYFGNIGVISLNLLKQDSTVHKPNEKWLNDIAEIKAKKKGNKLYILPILDYFNLEIISANSSRSPNRIQVETMLQQTAKRYPEMQNRYYILAKASNTKCEPILRFCIKMVLCRVCRER